MLFVNIRYETEYINEPILSNDIYIIINVLTLYILRFLLCFYNTIIRDTRAHNSKYMKYLMANTTYITICNVSFGCPICKEKNT